MSWTSATLRKFFWLKSNLKSYNKKGGSDNGAYLGMVHHMGIDVGSIDQRVFLEEERLDKGSEGDCGCDRVADAIQLFFVTISKALIQKSSAFRGNEERFASEWRRDVAAGEQFGDSLCVMVDGLCVFEEVAFFNCIWIAVIADAGKNIDF